MMQPCLIYLQLISLVAFPLQAGLSELAVWRTTSVASFEQLPSLKLVKGEPRYAIHLHYDLPG